MFLPPHSLAYKDRNFPRQGFTLIEVMVSIVITATLVGIGVARYREFNTRQTLDAARLTVIGGLRDIQAKSTSNLKPQVCSDNNWTLHSWQVNYWNTSTRCTEDPLDTSQPSCLRSEALCTHDDDGDGILNYEEAADSSATPHKFYHLPATVMFDPGDVSHNALHFLPLSQGVTFHPPPNHAADSLPRFIRIRTKSYPANSNTLWTAICIKAGGEISGCPTIAKGTTGPTAASCGCTP